MTDGWLEDRKYVLETLQDLKEGQDAMNDTVTLVRIDLAMLKVRAGIWGGLAGLVPAAVAVAAVIVGVGPA